MNSTQPISAELLNAYVDDELGALEREQVMLAIEEDNALKNQACEIGALKNMVRHAYAHATPPASSSRQSHHNRRQAIAACCLLLIGITLGWSVQLLQQTDAPTAAPTQKLTHNQHAPATAAQAERVLLHIDSAQPQIMKTGLDQAEAMLRQAKQNNAPLQLAVLANNGGLNLLRADTSPFTARLQELQTRYTNLELIACRQSVERLQQQGVDVQLVQGAHSNSTAIDTVAQRLSDGWHYIKVSPRGSIPAHPRLS